LRGFLFGVIMDRYHASPLGKAAPIGGQPDLKSGAG